MKKIITLCLFVVVATTALLTFAGCGNLSGLLGGLTGEDAEVFIDDLKSQEEVEAAIGNNYEMTLKYGYQSTDDQDGAAFITTKRAGNDEYTVITDSDGDTSAFLTMGDKFYKQLDVEVGKFTECSIYDASSYVNAYKQIMTGNLTSVQYNTKSDSTFLGRPVTTYKWKQEANVIIASFSYEWEYVVDKATGLLLKQAMNVSGSSIEGGASLATCFEVTKFTIGGVSLQNEIDKIGIGPWLTTEDFTNFGMSSVAQVNGTFYTSKATFGSKGIASEKQFAYVVSDANIFDTLCQQFYNAGFSKDDYCESKTVNELKVTSEYSDVKEFRGYIGQPNNGYDYSVEIIFTPSYHENNQFSLMITLYNYRAND